MTRAEILAAREAFKDGAKVRWNKGWRFTDKALDDEARVRYPLPLITRPRVLCFPNMNPATKSSRPDFYFKVEDKFLWWALPMVGYGVDWKKSYHDTPVILSAKLDLFAHPNEEVEGP